MKYSNSRIIYNALIETKVKVPTNKVNIVRPGRQPGCCWGESKILMLFHLDVSSVVTASLSVREALGSITGLVKSDTVSPTARLHCDVSSELCCSGA